MLVTLNRTPKIDHGPTDAIDFLLECHARIRRFCELARNVAAADETVPPNEVADATRRLLRYFGESLPMHALDEDRTLTPRLLPVAPLELAEALERQARDHVESDGILTELQPMWEALSHVREVDRVRQAELALALQQHFDAHLRLEEEVIFPAARRLLSPEAIIEVGAEMRARRTKHLESPRT